MLKWVLRIAYALLVILLAVFVYREADAKRRLDYLKNEAMDYYNEGDLDNYFKEFMVATSRDKYIEKPLYQAISSEENLEFTLSIFHTRAVTNQGEVDVAAFVLSNLDIRVTPLNEENYLNDTNLVRIRVNINLSEGHIYQDYNLEGKSLALTSTSSLGAAIPIELSIGEKDNISLFGLSSGTAIRIESITIELIDHSKLENVGEVSHIAKLENDSSLEEQFEVVDYLTRDEASFPIYDGEEDEMVEVNALVSTKFNGEAFRYNVGEQIYNGDSSDENVIYSNLDNLRSYNGVIYRYFTIFAVIIVIVTYLLFFLKPTIKHIRKRKFAKTVNDNENKIEPIFKD